MAQACVVIKGPSSLFEFVRQIKLGEEYCYKVGATGFANSESREKLAGLAGDSAQASHEGFTIFLRTT